MSKNKDWEIEELRARIAELEAERDYNRTAHDSATVRIAQLRKQMETAVLAERVACRDIAASYGSVGEDIAAAIRARPAP